MATYNKFYDFVKQLGLGTHNFNSHTLKVYASNTTPDADADDVKADLAEITAQNGYPSGGSSVTKTWSESSGTATLGVSADITWTASGGSFGPLRYAVLYNDTATNDNLIAWWDYGSSVTVNAGETFTIDFGSTIFTLA